MTYRLVKKNKFWRTLLFIVGGFVVFALIFELLAWWIGGTLWQGRMILSDWWGNTTTYFTDKKNLAEENQVLRNKIIAQETELLVLQSRIPAWQKFEQYQNDNFIYDRQTVRVLSRAPQTPFDELLIQGNDLQVGQAVYFQELLIGQVIAVQESYGRVALWSRVGNQVAVNIADDLINGVATGNGSGNLVLTLPAGTNIKTGDLVYLADNNQLIGRVSFVDNDENTPSFIAVFISLPFSPYNVEWLSVDRQAIILHDLFNKSNSSTSNEVENN